MGGWVFCCGWHVPSGGWGMACSTAQTAGNSLGNGLDGLILVHLVDDIGIMLQEDIALYLQRVGYLAALKREVVGHEREALYLLVIGECLLKGVYALGKHLVDNLVGTQLLTVLEGYAVGTGILLKQGIGGHDTDFMPASSPSWRSEMVTL